MTTTAKYLSDYKTPDFTIDDVSLIVELEPQTTLVTSVLQIRRLNSEARELVLDGEELQLKSIELNGKALDKSAYEVSKTALTLFNMPEQAELKIITLTNPEANTSLEGLYLSDGAFCTQCEAEGFRKITYYLDRPDVLAKFTTQVIADSHQYPYLLSNGNEVARETLDDGRLAVTWFDPHPKPCYLFALVAGDFDVLNDSFTTASGRQVKLQLFVDKGNLDRADYAMESLKNSMKWDEEVYGLEYDLDIYMIVAVDFFNMGAMENKGLNVFNSKYVLANTQTATDKDFFGIESVIGHEYFHNWTGNRVTCRDWFQLSLKEGLTVFRDQCFSQDMTQSSVCRIEDVAVVRNHQFAEDSGPMAHPIRPKSVVEMNNFYTVTVYNKGAEVIRMMHTLLGKEGYRKGIDLYFERHDGQAVTCDDFVAAMEDANEFDLSRFRQWYEQAGTPEVSAASYYDEAQQTLTLKLSQQVPATADCKEKTHTHIPLRIGLYSQSGAQLVLKTDSVLTDGNVYSLVEPSAEIVFKNIQEQPVPTLLEGYSAPIKLAYDYSDAQLLTLMQHCPDGFTRWDSGQELLGRYIKALMSGEVTELPDVVCEAFVALAQNETVEPALKEQLLTLPPVAALVNELPGVEIHQLLTAREQIEAQLAQALLPVLPALYQALQQESYELNAVAMGERALRSCYLYWIAAGDKAQGSELAEAQYQAATNMTDRLAALQAANAHSLECREALMSDFYDTWNQDGLVMDKWLALQGSWDHDNCLEHLNAVTELPVFSLNNPNRTRSLLSGFAALNHRQFHALDGSGYRWLAEKIKALNGINPQIAARLITPLTQWKRYADCHAQPMRAELESIKAIANLSRDLQELIEKSLNQA